MSEHRDGFDTTSATAIGNVRPWQTLASLGIAENDLATVHPWPRLGTAGPADRSEPRGPFEIVAATG